MIARAWSWLASAAPFRIVAFAVIASVFIHTQVLASLVYTYQPRIFWLRRGFLVDHLTTCGQPVRYLADALAQFFYFGGPGAVAWGVLIWLTGLSASLLAKAFGRALGRAVPRGLWILPTGGMFLLACRYGQDLATPLGILAAAGAALAYLRCRGWPTAYRLAMMGALIAALYYLAGGAAGIFVACCLAEMCLRRAWLAAAAGIALSVGIALGLEAILPSGADSLLSQRLPISVYTDPLNLWLAAGLWAWWPLLLLAIAAREPIGRLLRAAGRKLRSRRTQGPAGRGADREEPSRATRTPAASLGEATGPAAGRSFLAAQVHVLLLAAAWLPLGYLAIDQGLRTRLQIEYWSSMGQWSDIARVAPSLPAKYFDYATTMDVNLALYHSRRMLHEMFRYPQRYVLMPSISTGRGRDVRRMSELCLEWGRVNDAECILHEAAVVRSERPDVLRALAEVKMVKGQTDAARLYLNALRSNPIEGPWARDRLARLAADPLPGGRRGHPDPPAADAPQGRPGSGLCRGPE